MMKRILLACVSLFFLGCGNFLDINPESEVVNDDMFSTAEGVEDALYGVYMSMVKEDMYGGGEEMLDALKSAAKRGVDVRLILPGIQIGRAHV